MSIPDRQLSLQPLKETRAKIEEILPGIDPQKRVYPDWTIKELLAHMSGWDEATIDILRSHNLGRPPSLKPIHDLDAYNKQTVSSRQDLTYEQVIKEWRFTRQVLCSLIEDLPEEKFLSPVIVPWGGKSTVIFIMDMFRNHEEEHYQDIVKWLDKSENHFKMKGK